MTDFAARARAALDDQGLSMRGAARALNYDPAYVSRVLNRKQQPSPQLARALDQLVDAEGELVSLAPPSAPPSPEPEGVDADIAHIRSTVAHVLDHDGRYGGVQVAPVAVQVWRAAQGKLDSGAVPDGRRRECLSAVAEMAEVAGWLLFDADQPEASRAAFLDSHLLARQAGDRPMEWFALDMLAMLGIQYGRPGETLRVADELLSRPRIPPRVALLARVRRGRALSQTGERGRALAELHAAKAALAESIAPRDPVWAWWVTECELSGHEGEVLLALGEIDKAVLHLQRARELAQEFRPDGRGTLHYSVALLEAYATARAWRECESTLLTLPPLLDTVTSERSHNRLRNTLRGLVRDPKTPAWLSELASDRVVRR